MFVGSGGLKQQAASGPHGQPDTKQLGKKYVAVHLSIVTTIWEVMCFLR